MSAPEPRTRSGVPIVPALDGFRAYAILSIVFLHVLALAGAFDATRDTTGGLLIWALLGNGIDAFFIISGFVIFLPIVVREGALGSVRAFVVGRAARLVPAYWLILAVMLVLLAYVPTQPPLAMPSVANVLAHLTFLQMPAKLLDSGFALGFGVNGPIWMLSVIAGFYVLLPLIARAYYRHPLAGLVIAALVTFGWKEAAVQFHGAFAALGGGSAPGWIVPLVVSDQLPGWAFSFALGMTAAWGYVRLLDRHPTAVITSRAALVATVALPIYALLAYLYGRAAYTSSAALSGSVARLSPWDSLGGSASRAVLMASIALGPYWMVRPFVNRVTRRLGEVSYGLYLVHFVVGTYAGLLLGLPTDGTLGTVALWSAVVILPSLAYAFLSARFVEQPVRRWARSYERRRRATEARAVQAMPEGAESRA